MLLDEEGNVAPLRAIVGIDVDSGLPVIVAVKAGKIQCDTELTISGGGLATTAKQDSLISLIGEASANPAENSVLDLGH